MENLNGVIDTLPLLKDGGEPLFRAIDLERALRGFGENEIEAVDGYLLSPFLVQDGYRLDLYEYEMQINLVERKDFVGHVLAVAGKTYIEEVPDWIIEWQRHLLVELTSDELCSVRNPILDYLDFLFAELESNYDWDAYSAHKLQFAKEKIFLAVY